MTLPLDSPTPPPKLPWQPIETAILDGRTYLVAATSFLDKWQRKGFERNNIVVPTRTFLARWSTWDQAWRRVPDGEKIGFPDVFEPHACIELGDIPPRTF